MNEAGYVYSQNKLRWEFSSQLTHILPSEIEPMSSEMENDLGQLKTQYIIRLERMIIDMRNAAAVSIAYRPELQDKS